VNPSFFKRTPAAAASCSPFLDRGQSYHPVNLFSSFHVDSPWRTSTSVCLLRLNDDLIDDDDDDDDDDVDDDAFTSNLDTDRDPLIIVVIVVIVIVIVYKE
jgi:hypothetical protein